MKDAHKLGEKPVLYENEASYYSQVVRLALAEKGQLEAVQRRHMALQEKCEQLEPWFLKINPHGTVPVLLKPADDKVVCGTIDIIRDLDALEGHSLLASGDKAKIESLIKLHEDAETQPVMHLLYGHYIKTNPVGKAVLPRDLHHAIDKLKKLKEDEHAELPVRSAAEAKLKEKEELLAKFEAEPNTLYDDSKPKVVEVLDKLEKELSGESREGPFLAGKEYSLADVLFTVMLARLHWIEPMKEEIKSRAKLSEYYALVKERPAFKAADVWEDLRPGMVVHMLTEVAVYSVVKAGEQAGEFLHVHVGVPIVKTASATGEFFNEKVVHPITESPTYKAMQVGATVAGATVHTFWEEKVVHPIAESEAYKAVSEKSKEAWEATQEKSKEAWEATKNAGSFVAEKTAAGAAMAAEYTHKASDFVVHKVKGDGEEKKEGEEGEHKKK